MSVIPLVEGQLVTFYRHGFIINFNKDTKRFVWYKDVVQVELKKPKVIITLNDSVGIPITFNIERCAAVNEVYERICSDLNAFMENHWKWPIEELVARASLEPAVGTEFKEAQARQVGNGMNL